MIREAIKFIERYIDNSSAEKEWVLASKGFLPLTPTIVREFEEEVDRVYHVTDEDGLRMLKKIQGQKKEISTFSRGDSGISYGARREAQFLVELSGKSSFNADSDLYSQLSRNGYKWLDPTRTEKDYVVNNEFSVPMFKKMVKHLALDDRHQIQNELSEFDGKGKAKFMKWYFDTSKKLVTKKLLDKIKKSVEKGKRTMSGWDSDEYFLNQIKVKGVKVIIHEPDKWDTYPQEFPERDALIKKLGFKHNGTISPEQIAKIGR